MDTMAGLSRSHYCAAVTEEDQGKEVVLCGWVERRRDHGGLILSTYETVRVLYRSLLRRTMKRHRLTRRNRFVRNMSSLFAVLSACVMKRQ